MSRRVPASAGKELTLETTLAALREMGHEPEVVHFVHVYVKRGESPTDYITIHSFDEHGLPNQFVGDRRKSVDVDGVNVCKTPLGVAKAVQAIKAGKKLGHIGRPRPKGTR